MIGGDGSVLQVNQGPTSIFVDGSVIGARSVGLQSIGIAAFGPLNDINITIGRDGIVAAEDFAIILAASNSTVTSHGTIAGANVSAVDLYDNGRLYNSGEITGSVAIRVFADSNSPASIVNTGEIGSWESTPQAIQLFGPSAIRNSGEIHGSIVSGDTDAILRLTNAGLIDGVVEGSQNGDRVTNAGTITDGAFLGLGSDVYIGAGSVGTLIAGQEGRDLIEGGSGDETVFGGDDDNVRGRGGADLISGQTGDDVLTGGAGDDDASGGTGADLVFGGAGADQLSGDADNDIVRGQQGEDELLGGAGNDALFGGAGDDVLDGRTGTDVLAGGTGADEFRYGPGGGLDIIVDLRDDVDAIDLTAFGFAGRQAALDLAEEVNGNVLFAFGSGDRLIVRGIALADLADDILV